MSEQKENSCKHSYKIDYSFRIPQPFFRSLPCDQCGRRIKLSPAWRIFYWLVDFIGFVIAFEIALSVQVKVFGNTFVVSLLVFAALLWLLQLPCRLIFRYGKWVEADKK